MASATWASSNGGAAEPSSTMTDLKRAILNLCNEYIGFSNKLQIVGILCMTVDDEQHELVLKINNTLMRVTPENQKDNGPQMTSNQVANPSMLMRVAQSQQHAVERPQQVVENLNGSSAGPAMNCVPNGYGGSSGAERKSHGRKRANPVKVHQVFDEADLGSDEEEPVTVIPEAPETTMSMTSMSPSPSGGMSIANKARLISDVKASGSAKRKPSQQFRVPQFISTSKNPHMRQALSEAASSSPFGSEAGDADNSNEPQNLSTNGSQSGLSLPIFIAGAQQNGVINPIEITPDNCSDSERDDPSRSPSKSPGELYIDEDNTSVKVKEEKPESNLNNTFMSPTTSRGDVALDFSRSGLQNMASLYGLTSSSLVDSSNLASQHPYPALNLLTSMRQTDPTSGALAEGRDGLTIKYTPTGPYTVGANGKDVSNSSRIKDIIMYDEHSPVNVQKGQKMERDFIVDKLGMDGRKRRRRAPEDQLTPEEIAEYLGQPDKADFSFKCKYCTEVFDSVTRYIHHTLASHQAYVCHQCGKSFTTKSSLLRHRPIHTGMRRFACSICKKTFYRKDKCKAHIKRHLGIDANQTADNSTVMNQFQNIEMAAVELE